MSGINLNNNQFHEELLRTQENSIKNWNSPGSTSAPPAMAPILLTPLLGDGKTSRQAGMNLFKLDPATSKLEQRQKARTEPKAHAIGPREKRAFIDKCAGIPRYTSAEIFGDPNIQVMLPGIVSSTALATERAFRDETAKSSWTKGLGVASLIGLGGGTLSGVLHSARGLDQPLKATAIHMGYLGLIAPAVYSIFRGSAKLETRLRDYVKDNFTGPTSTP